MMVGRELYIGTREYNNMDLAAKLATWLSPNHWEYRMETTYSDFNCVWTTLVVHRDDGELYQALYEKEWNEIVSATEPEQVIAVMRRYFADKYCLDRERKVRR